MSSPLEAPPLSPLDKNSFAYVTVKDRLPVILGKIIDAAHRGWEPIAEIHGEVAKEDVNNVIATLSKLHYQLQTNKPFEPIEDDYYDKDIWNEELKKISASLNHPVKWFESTWLFSETFLYRKANEAFFKSKYMKDFDPFSDIKVDSYKTSIDAIKTLCEYIYKFDNEGLNNEESVEEIFHNVLKMALWGNKCDLSLTNMNVSEKVQDPLETLEAYDEFILRNDLQAVWNYLQEVNDKKSTDTCQSSNNAPNKSLTNPFKGKEYCPRPEDKIRRLDLILDNAGFELFTDFVLANFFLRANIVDRVILHGKIMPWFVSDTTERDIFQLLDDVEKLDNKYCSHFVKALRRIFEGYHPRFYGAKWEVPPLVYQTHMFWTLSLDYDRMEEVAPDLYKSLSKADILIFKGDLNFRKLTGDRAWPHTTSFREALRRFKPAPLLSLRTVKCETVVGLPPEIDEISKSFPQNWMLTGDYAIIEFDC